MMGAWDGRVGFAEVFAAARAGDERAFASLWRWLHPLLLRWLSVVVPGGAEDVASEVWLTVTRDLDVFEGDERDFRGWVFTIARRRAVDWARGRARQPQVVHLGEVDLVDPVATSSLLVDQADAQRAALGLMQELTDDQREVLALRVIVGMTVTETAAVVGKSDGAVRVLSHRALRSLAERLEAEKQARGAPA
jgi:RNA polymerase sigma-70 factor (ECF subfamily)